MLATTALAIGLGAAATAGGVTQGVLGSRAANKASTTQANAATQAAQLQKQASDEAIAEQRRQYDASLAEQQRQFGIGQNEIAPWLQQGTSAINTLGGLLAPGGELSKGWTGTFAPPTNITESNDPGFQARLALGQQAIERSAAARGTNLSGGTLKDLNQFGQDYASNEYGNIYNRALQNYTLGQNTFYQNQNNLFNRYATLAGYGQQAANTGVAAGANEANAITGLNTTTGANIGNILVNSASNQGNALQNAAAARASGYAGSASAINSGIGTALNGITGGALLSNILGRGSSYPSLSGPTGGYYTIGNGTEVV